MTRARPASRAVTAVAAVAGVALLLSPAVAAAQEVPHARRDTLSLPPEGSLVRVRAPLVSRPAITGTLRAWRGDTLVVAPITSRGTVAIPLDAVESLDRSVGSGRGRRAAAGAGATIGGLLGFGVGAMVAFIPTMGGDAHRPREAASPWPMVGGVVVGGMLGGHLGWRVGPRRWMPVPLTAR